MIASVLDWRPEVRLEGEQTETNLTQVYHVFARKLMLQTVEVIDSSKRHISVQLTFLQVT
jgi:hypothetical protein